uniref:Uncharacterized protein n=1 Tax=Octopus bimaculoides TaxID=37653 RepID=A0A0L8HRV4_OCTBM
MSENSSVFFFGCICCQIGMKTVSIFSSVAADVMMLKRFRVFRYMSFHCLLMFMLFVFLAYVIKSPNSVELAADMSCFMKSCILPWTVILSVYLSSLLLLCSSVVWIAVMVVFTLR